MALPQGFEPRFTDSKSAVLPVGRRENMALETGFEPILWRPERQVLPVELFQTINGAPPRIRTENL